MVMESGYPGKLDGDNERIQASGLFSITFSAPLVCSKCFVDGRFPLLGHPVPICTTFLAAMLLSHTTLLI